MIKKFQMDRSRYNKTLYVHSARLTNVVVHADEFTE